MKYPYMYFPTRSSDIIFFSNKQQVYKTEQPILTNERVDTNMEAKINIETASDLYRYCLLLYYFITMFTCSAEIYTIIYYKCIQSLLDTVPVPLHYIKPTMKFL
jgi:hypothetical protein